METYDAPASTEGLTAEQAGQAGDKLRADILADTAHPFNDGNHALHDDFVRHFGALQRVVREGEAGAQAERSAAELAEALGEDAGLSPAESRARAKELLSTPGFVTQSPGVMSEEKRGALTRKIHALYQVAAPVMGVAEDLARLKALDVEGAADFDIENVQEPWQAAGLKMQRLLAEKNFGRLKPLIEMGMRDVQAPPEIRALFQRFTEAVETAAPLEHTADLAYALLAFFYDAHAPLDDE